MSTATTLIQPQEVTNAGILRGAPISSRFDSSLLAAHIKPAEIRFIRPLLCEDFYNDLITVKAGVISSYNTAIDPTVTEAFPTNAVYENLWKEYLLPLLSYCVLWEAMPFISQQVATAGVQVFEPSYSTAQGDQGGRSLEDKLLSTIEVLKEDLRKHLCKNKDIYPLFCFECWCKCECNSDTCDVCRKNKEVAPKLGVIFYEKNEHKYKDNFYYKNRDKWD